MRKSLLSLFARVPVAHVLCLVAAGVLPAIVLPAVAGAETCPNAQFRAGASANLPDCRAYEMVTPPYKDGYVINTYQVNELETGPLITAKTFGVFAGTESDTSLGNLYEFARTTSGWRSASLIPPVSLFPQVDSGYRVSPDGSSLLELGRQPGNIAASGEAELIYIKSPDGALTEVGPMIPPSAKRRIGNSGQVIGASRNFSHVLFRVGSSGEPATNHLWPFDTTVGENNQSLYEYVGTGNSQPVLVGVNGGAGSTNLISQCGVELGGSRSSYTYNAISADGSIVFFTPVGPSGHHGLTCGGQQPPVEEVAARVDGSQTVAVSEPSLSYCSSSPCADAEFQGASEDGSKVFFTSTQGEEAPGVADTTNNLYEAQLGEVDGEWVRKGVVQVSAGDTSGKGAQVQGVSAISEDGSHVYFVAQGVLASNGGAAVEPGTGLPQHAAAGAENLYLYERDAAYPAGRTVFIAQLSPNDSGDWGGAGGGQATKNGNFLVFGSVSDLTPDDTTTNGEHQLFEYDALSGALVRVSIGQDGFNDNGNNPPRNASASTVEGRSLSEDGSYVFFSSTNGLTPQALNHEVTQVIEGRKHYANNVYEYHAGNVYLISDGRDTAAQEGSSSVSLLGTDASGADVFFTTSDQLVAQDTDSEPDVYDARIDGGFPAPVSLLPSCSGDDCQGKLSSVPVLLSPGSEFQAGQNPPLAAPLPVVKAKAKPKTGSGKCKKGFVKRRGRCVKGRASKRSAKGRK